MCAHVCRLVLMFISKETPNYSERLKQAQLPRGTAEKEGRYLAGQAKETKQSQMRSPEEYTPASIGEKQPRGGRGEKTQDEK